MQRKNTEIRPEPRELFEIEEGVAYFNTASLAPQLRSVRAAGEEALKRRGAPWRVRSADWFSESERLRDLFGQLIGTDGEGVALIPASSYGMAVAAANLEAVPADRVVVLDQEYPSGIYTWQAFTQRTGAELHFVAREEGQTWSDAILAALDERAAIVSVPNVHWTDGSLIDLGPVAERTHELGAALVLDLSQSLGAMPVDVGELRPDFLISVGYKWLLGPFSLGYMYVDEKHRDGEPIEHNWILREGAEDFVPSSTTRRACSPARAASTSASARTSSSRRWRSPPWSRSSNGPCPGSERAWPRRRRWWRRARTLAGWRRYRPGCGDRT